MDDYWASDAAKNRQRWRRRADVARAVVHTEPQRKGQRGGRHGDLRFRESVREQLQSQRLQGWPRAPLALDLSITSTKAQPAAANAYAKHYLDLLEAESLTSEEGRVLYANDRQVKLLAVTCWDAAGRGVEPGIRLTCRPRRHVVADCEVAQELGYSDYLDDLREDVEDAPSFVNGASLAAFGPEGIDLAERLAILDRQRAQERLLRANELSFAWFLSRFASELLLDAPNSAARRLVRDGPAFGRSGARERRVRQFSDMLIQVRLPPLPDERGGGTRFAEAVLEACESFRARHPHLRPLLVPLRITLLLVPPRQGKDLDNVMTAVVRGVKAVLQPEPWPITPELSKALDLRRPPSRHVPDPPVSVTSYQVIELARAPEDPPQGVLSMVLGSDQEFCSTWVAVERFVDAQLDLRC